MGDPLSSFAMLKATASRSDLCTLAMILTLVGTTGCRSWDETKSFYLQDANALLHKRYPTALRNHDLDEILELCSPELRRNSTFVTRTKKFLAAFSQIDWATCIIVDLEPYDGHGPAKARLDLAIHGVDQNGERRSHFRELEVEYARVGTEDSDLKITRETVVTQQDVSAPPTVFRDETNERGLRNFPNIGTVLDRDGNPKDYLAGSGVALGDLNSDGKDDIYFTNGNVCKLLINRDGTHFEDVTESAGCDGRMQNDNAKTRFALIADYDNDGRRDIFVGVLNGANLLYHQNPDGTFTDVASRAGLVPTLETAAAVFGDFDRDGFLDLYVVNGRTPWIEEPEPVYNALNGFPNRLFMNNRDGTFRDTSVEAGVAHTGYGLSCAASDYDVDGDLDIFVGNDFGPDVLYRNRGDGTFEDVTRESGMRYRGSTMGASWGDLDGDGYPELFASGMFSNSQWMIDQPGYPAPAPWPISWILRSQILDILKEMFSGNMIYKNNSGQTFTRDFDVTQNTGWSWGSAFLDVDNDSHLDLYVVNGLKSGEDSRDL